jgi:SAM-dependent methyltransferase
MASEIRSYTSVEGKGPSSLLEFVRLFRRSRRASQNIEAEVKEALRMLHECESLVKEHTGVALEGLRVLEIGPGQMPRQLAYFGARNDVVGVDLDVIPTGWNVRQYWRLFRRNGPKRLIKTLARKLLGFDAKFRKELCRQMGIDRLPAPRLMEMDATRLDFADASFDFVYSFSVFEHLPDPAAVLREVRRILKPGGVAYHHLHLYTCDDGCHDLRIRGEFRDGDMPYWPHLRSQHRDKVQAFAYINKLSLDDWRRVFSSELPGVNFAHDMDRGHLPEMLAKLRADGELAGYTDEELLTHNFIMIWQKPADPAKAGG